VNERKGYIYSGLLHLAVVILMVLGLPSLLQTEIEPAPPITVELMNISDLPSPPNAKVDETKPEKKKEQPKPTPPVKEPVAEEKEPTPQTMEELLAVEEDIIKDLIPVETPEEVKPEPKPDPKPDPKPEPKKEEKPKEKPKDKPKKKAKDKAKKSDAFDSILKNVEKLEPTVAQSFGSDDEDITKILSSSELDALRQQVASCWNVAAGARDAQDLIVDVHVELDDGAAVKVASIVGGTKSSPYFRVASDSAVRALKNPRCTPLKIPKNKLAKMQSFTFRFNPKDMF